MTFLILLSDIGFPKSFSPKKQTHHIYIFEYKVTEEFVFEGNIKETSLETEKLVHLQCN